MSESKYFKYFFQFTNTKLYVFLISCKGVCLLKLRATVLYLNILTVIYFYFSMEHETETGPEEES